jgi:hypothetical protein
MRRFHVEHPASSVIDRTVADDVLAREEPEEEEEEEEDEDEESDESGDGYSE